MSYVTEESEGSNLDSLISTPHSSPFQQVPADESHRSSYLDDTLTNGHSPYLRIIIEPQAQFRFRYKTEREGGTHGYLQGESLIPDSGKQFPTVELRNYKGKAVIKCQLYQCDKYEEHPHILHEENQGDREPKVIVSEKKGYIVCFKGLGIIQLTRKEIEGKLFDKLKKCMSDAEYRKLNKNKLRDSCKKIDLNRVRLRFSAHDATSDKELCKVYSKIINNKKSPETNKLEICRSSRATGSAVGGDGIMLFVEKVNKGKIRVNFFEKNSTGEKCWERPAKIHEVHRQYGIFISTPAYDDPETTHDVPVWMELQRTTDGSCSEPREFLYTPEPRHLLRKRARLGFDTQHTIVPVGSASEVFLENSEIPLLEDQTKEETFDLQAEIDMNDTTVQFDIVEACDNPNAASPVERAGEPGAALPVQQLANIFNQGPDDIGDFEDFMRNHWDTILPEYDWGIEDPSEYQQLQLVTDKPQPILKHEMVSEYRCEKGDIKLDDGLQMQTLIKEICELKREKLREWYEEVTEKLERLFELRLQNGDTVAHALLWGGLSGRRALRRLAALAAALGRGALLSARDAAGRAVLHHAVAAHMPDLEYLLHYGCDPEWDDAEGNTALHHAVRAGGRALPPLLAALAARTAPAPSRVNAEGLTPVALAERLQCARSLQLLRAVLPESSEKAEDDISSKLGDMNINSN